MVLTLFGITFERKKNAHLERHLVENLHIDIISWTGCQNNPIDVNFHLQKSLEIFEKKSADKI